MQHTVTADKAGFDTLQTEMLKVNNPVQQFGSTGKFASACRCIFRSTRCWEDALDRR